MVYTKFWDEVGHEGDPADGERGLLDLARSLGWQPSDGDKATFVTNALVSEKRTEIIRMDNALAEASANAANRPVIQTIANNIGRRNR